MTRALRTNPLDSPEGGPPTPPPPPPLIRRTTAPWRHESSYPLHVATPEGPCPSSNRVRPPRYDAPPRAPTPPGRSIRRRDRARRMRRGARGPLPVRSSRIDPPGTFRGRNGSHGGKRGPPAERHPDEPPSRVRTRGAFGSRPVCTTPRRPRNLLGARWAPADPAIDRGVGNKERVRPPARPGRAVSVTGTTQATGHRAA